MKHTTALIIATALTAFVLIFLGGITATVTPKAMALANSPTPADAPTQAPTQPQTQSQLATLAPTHTAIVAQQSKTSATGAPQISVLSAAQASRVALLLASGAKLQKSPELVNYKGRMAYEVVLDQGTVYVDAFTGKVLYNGIGLAPTATTVAPPTTDPGANTGGGGGGGGGGNSGGGGGGGQNAGHGQTSPPSTNPGPKGGGEQEGHGGHGGGGHGGGGGDD